MRRLFPFQAPESECLTEEQAIAFFNGDEWKSWTSEQVFVFQMRQPLLCVPFSLYHKAASDVLGRPVFSHEFALLSLPQLWDEYMGKRGRRSLSEVVALLPTSKTITVLK